MTHQNEYHDNMVKMLELIWGKGYMAPGGPSNVARLLEGTQPAGKHILDVGCGIGGPAFEMLTTHGAQVTGIDLEKPLVDRAKSDAREHGLHEHCQFLTVAPGPLPFADGSFDIVVSSGAITQTPGKSALLGECHRVLANNGHLTCYEWMSSGKPQSADMDYWIELEGLSYTLETLQTYAERFRQAGFADVVADDASAWYREESRREYELIKEGLYDTMVELLGQQDADHFVENWRLLAIVCEFGELRQGYVRGRKHVA